MSAADALIHCRALVKTYRLGDETVNALAGISLDVHHGEFVAITGPSGSGKSTLLNLIAGIDTPDSGKLEIEGVRIVNVKSKEKRMGKFVGRRSGWKKAYVNLKAGQDINFAEGENK